jgi:hypothetical protein
MATLTLAKFWINLMADGSAFSAYSDERSFEFGTESEVRTYAGGRRRNITTPSTSKSFSVKLKVLTLTQVTALELWLDRVVQIRDYRGFRMIGVFRDCKVTEHKADLDYDVSLSFEQLTHLDGV